MNQTPTPSQVDRQLPVAMVDLGAPTPATAPHFTLSPQTGDGERTAGFTLAIFSPPESGATGPFTITPYRWVAAAKAWARGAPFVGAAFGDALVCYDIGSGAKLYFNVASDSPGDIILSLAELA